LKKKKSKLLIALGIFLIAFLFLLKVALYLVIIPFIVWKLLLLCGVGIGFWLTFGIVLVFYLLVRMLKS